MTIEEWFNQVFWPMYPLDLARKKKGPKLVALEAMKKKNPDEKMREMIMNRMRETIRHCRIEKKMGMDTDRWPFASTWINQERWNDIEDLPSTAEVLSYRKCSCGKDAEIKTKCWECYSDDKSHDQFLYARLCEIGLGKLKEESRPEYNARCRSYYQENFMGKVHIGRTEVPEGIK